MKKKIVIQLNQNRLLYISVLKLFFHTGLLANTKCRPIYNCVQKFTRRAPVTYLTVHICIAAYYYVYHAYIIFV